MCYTKQRMLSCPGPALQRTFNIQVSMTRRFTTFRCKTSCRWSLVVHLSRTCLLGFLAASTKIQNSCRPACLSPCPMPRTFHPSVPAHQCFPSTAHLNTCLRLPNQALGMVFLDPRTSPHDQSLSLTIPSAHHDMQLRLVLKQANLIPLSFGLLSSRSKLKDLHRRYTITDICSSHYNPAHFRNLDFIPEKYDPAHPNSPPKTRGINNAARARRGGRHRSG